MNLRKLMNCGFLRTNALSKSVANLPAVKNQREGERDVTIESMDSVLRLQKREGKVKKSVGKIWQRTELSAQQSLMPSCYPP